MERLTLLRHVVNAAERLELSYFITGSVASMHYGEPRLTNDIDIVVNLPRDAVTPFCAAFPPPRFYVSEEAASDAVERGGQFNILQPETGLKVDVIVSRMDQYDRHRFSRTIRDTAGPGFEARFASPEDVIIKKMDYYQQGESEKHLRDITGIIRSRGETLDRSYIELWARELGLESIWRAIRLKCGEL